MEGFIYLHRKLLDSRLFKNEGLLKIWIWILLKANHQSKWFQIETGKGINEIQCNRGELIVGRLKASKELDMSPSRFYNLLSKLKRLKKITLEPSAHYTKIKVIKYADYQTYMSEGGQATDKLQTGYGQATDRLRTGNGQATDTNNNVNKDNNVNKVNKKDEQKAPISLHGKLKEIFINYYNQETTDTYYWTAKDGANLKKLIAKLKFSFKEKKIPDTEEEIIKGFEMLIHSLPEWYKIEAFDVASINSNYNKIINSIINGKEKQAPSLQRGFSKIDDLFKQ